MIRLFILAACFFVTTVSHAELMQCDDARECSLVCYFPSSSGRTDHVYPVNGVTVDRVQVEAVGEDNLLYTSQRADRSGTMTTYHPLESFILPKDYPELNCKEIDIYLVQSGGKLLKGMSKASSKASEQFLKELGVHIIFNKRVEDYDGEKVYLNDGSTIHANKVQFMRNEFHVRPTDGESVLVVSGGADGGNLIKDTIFYLDDDYNTWFCEYGCTGPLPICMASNAGTGVSSASSAPSVRSRSPYSNGSSSNRWPLVLSSKKVTVSPCRVATQLAALL